MGSRGRRNIRRSYVLDMAAEQVLETVEALAEQTYVMPTRPDPNLITRGYEVTGSVWGGEGQPHYPLFPTDRAWVLVARDSETMGDNPVDVRHNLGMEKPTLSWQNGNKRVELYVDGMDHIEFQERYGLEISVDKNGFVTAKRMSRSFRSYRASAFLSADDVSVDYMDLDERGEKLWDGAGLISRRMLEEMHISPNMSEAEAEQLREELRHTQHVEFTFDTADGQNKGHAIVVDDLDVDFRLPRDVKEEVKRTDGRVFIGINTIHSSDHMRLDVQSIMNMYPFFSGQEMLRHLGDHSQLVRDAIETGRKGALMARMDGANVKDIEDWPLRNFFARGGDAKWFPGAIKHLINGNIQRINTGLERGKLNIPFNGGRYYMMTEAVAQAAGLDISVPPGGVHLDPKTGSAWINNDDWIRLRGSDQGVADILGGADQDDAMWVHGFTDHDGVQKVVGWRSPNNTGEYMLFKPTEGSQMMAWDRPDGDVEIYPPGDSRLLPNRIDVGNGTTFAEMADAPKPGELGQGQPYSPAVMDEVGQRTQENKGVLGAYCNYIMAYRAVTGKAPPWLPAMLEAVIDNDVKLGGSNARVGAELDRLNFEFLQTGVAIPKFLLSRFSIYPDPQTGQYPTHKKFVFGEGEDAVVKWAPITISDGTHWVDRWVAGAQKVERELTAYRDQEMLAARIPGIIHERMADDPEAVKIGADLNSCYAKATKAARVQYGGILTQAQERIVLDADGNHVSERVAPDPRGMDILRKRYDDLVREHARKETEAFLDRYPADRHQAIMLGSMVSRERTKKEYDKETGVETVKSDAVLWQKGRMSQLTMAALVDVGVLGEIKDEITENGRRVVHYPTPDQAARQATYDPVVIDHVWYNRELAEREDTIRISAVDKETKRRRTQQVLNLARITNEKGGYVGKRLTVGEMDTGGATPRRVFQDEEGRVFGTIPKKDEGSWLVGESVVMRTVRAMKDGKLQTMVQRLDQY